MLVVESPGLILAIVLALVGLGLWLRSRQLRVESGLPAGDIIYADDGAWVRNRETLRDADLMLAGRPDYLVERRDGRVVPVEVKHALAPATPHAGHVLQLAAYCYLVETEFGVRPDVGIVQYRDRAFAVEFTPALEREMLATIDEMRVSLAAAEELPRSHDQWRRCQRCGVSQACDQSLA